MPSLWKGHGDTTDITPQLPRLAVRGADTRRMFDRGKPLSLGNRYHLPSPPAGLARSASGASPIVFQRLPKRGPSREAICAAMQEIEAQGHFKVELLTVRDSDDRITKCYATLSLIDEDGEFLRTLLDVEGRDELDALDKIERWLNSHGPAAA